MVNDNEYIYKLIICHISVDCFVTV